MRTAASTFAIATCCAACGSRTGLIVLDDTPDAEHHADANGDDGAAERDAAVEASFDAAPDAVVDETPRLIAPLSTTTVRTTSPTLRWKNPAGVTTAEVLVCADRDCSKVVVDASVAGDRASVPLGPGAYFWNVRWGSRRSATWEMFVPRRPNGSVDTSWGTMLDVNADGFADVVLRQAATLEVHLGSPVGPGTAATHIGFSPDHAAGVMVVTSAGDLNGDGFPEVVVGSVLPGDVGNAALVFAGSRTGLSATSVYVPEPAPPADVDSFPRSVVAVGDVDDDGYGDLVLTSPAAHDGLGRAYLFKGSAAGISTTPDLVLVGNDAYGSRFGVEAGAIDIDGDGRSELFVAQASPDSVLVFRLPSATPIETIPTSGLFADFNCDGFGDLAVELPGKIEFHRGGAGGLGPPETYALPIGPSYGYLHVAGDDDGDGCDDALWTDHVDATVSMWRGDPSTFLVPGPSLGFAVSLPFGGTHALVLLGDVDGDGRADVAASNKGGVFDGHLGAATGLSPTAAFSFAAWDVGSSQ